MCSLDTDGECQITSKQMDELGALWRKKHIQKYPTPLYLALRQYEPKETSEAAVKQCITENRFWISGYVTVKWGSVELLARLLP